MTAAQPDSRVPASPATEPAAGFSLLEVVVALALLAVVLLAVHRLQGQSIRMAQEARRLSVAPLLTQGKIDEIAAREDLGPLSEEGDFGDAMPGWRWSARVTEMTFDPEVLPENAGTLLQIELDTRFNDLPGIFTLRTYKWLPP